MPGVHRMGSPFQSTTTLMARREKCLRSVALLISLTYLTHSPSRAVLSLKASNVELSEYPFSLCVDIVGALQSPGSFGSSSCRQRGVMPQKPVIFEGSDHFRQRLLLSTLSNRPVRFEKIRADSDEPGLKDYEVSFLRLLDKVCNGARIDINYSGTTVTYRPGLIIGGKVRHTCATSKAVGYYLEPITCIAPFAKKPVLLTLEGVTNNDVDPSVDALRTVALPLLRRFGIDMGLELKVSKRGAPPLGGGEIFFRCPIVRALTPIKLLECGRIKRVRGIAYSSRVSPQISNRVVDSTRGVLNQLLPDVYVYTDNYRGAEAGKSPGFGLSLVAESTTGALLSAECIARPAELPEDLGKRAAKSLLAEIGRSGCVDTQHQAMCLLLMALCPEDLSKVRMGNGITQYTIQYLRDIRTFIGTTFRIKPDDESGTTLFSCIGSGYINVSKKAA